MRRQPVNEGETIVIDETQFRQFARAGALEACRHAIAEFPDILAELNIAAKPVREPRAKKKRTMSPEARKRISDAQKARWKKKRNGK